MALGSIPRRVIWLAVVAILVFAATAMNSPNESEICEMTVFVGDTVAVPNATNTVVSVFADNIFDTVVGFALWIKLDRPPDIMAFQTDSGTAVDTLYWQCVQYSGPDCIDSVSVSADDDWDFYHIDTFDVEIGNFDTTGTLIAGWEYVQSRSISGNGTDLLIIGIANLAGPPVTRGFAPQQGGRLIKLLADVYDVLDTTYWLCNTWSGPVCLDSVNVPPESTWDIMHIDTVADRNVVLQIEKEFKDNLNIVTPNPAWSIWAYEQFMDTNGFVCTQWSIDSGVNPPETLGCAAYQETSLPPWDSIEVKPDSEAYLDTTRICLYDGTLFITLPPSFLCGDCNGDGSVGNILDLNFLINRIFRFGPASVPPEASDLNCDGGNGNILDLNLIINRIFRFGPPVCSAPACN